MTIEQALSNPKLIEALKKPYNAKTDEDFNLIDATAVYVGKTSILNLTENINNQIVVS